MISSFGVGVVRYGEAGNNIDIGIRLDGSVVGG